MSEVDKTQLRNRLLSIIHDRFYLENSLALLSQKYKVIPNERCGKWYCGTNDISCYFKSTDGHSNQWNFNYRRLNLNILPSLLQNRGLIIVDSSKYRQIPDSLSKTIPIWCCVLSIIINESYFLRDDDTLDMVKFMDLSKFLLVLPMELEVVKDEYEAILSKVIDFYKLSKKYHPELNDKLKKLGFKRNSQNGIVNLKPSWMYPGSVIDEFDGAETSFSGCPVETYNVILCSVSEFGHISRHNGMLKYHPNKGHNKYNFSFNYYQGAGDDHELWSLKLDPETFNKNVKKIEDELMKPEKESLNSLWHYIETLNVVSGELSDRLDCFMIHPNVFLCTNDMLCRMDLTAFDKIICFGMTENVIFPKGSILLPNMTDNKKGIRLFASNLNKIDADVLNPLAKLPSKKILFSSEKFELNIGIALIYLAKYKQEAAFNKKDWDKIKLRQLYNSICNTIDTNVNTSRLLLNNINSFILS